MSLNKQFFDSISIELVKRKYYIANNVDSILAAIRGEALAMDEELKDLRGQLAALQSQKAEISEAVMSAQRLSAEIVQQAERKAAELEDRAAEKAAEIVAEAEKKAAEIAEAAVLDSQRTRESAEEEMTKARAIHEELTGRKQRRQEYAVDKVEACFSMLRQQYQDTIDSLNARWQDFLCGLYDDDSVPDGNMFEEETEVPAVLPDVQPEAAEAVPADLGEKLDAIARELEELAAKEIEALTTAE